MWRTTPNSSRSIRISNASRAGRPSNSLQRFSRAVVRADLKDSAFRKPRGQPCMSSYSNLFELDGLAQDDTTRVALERTTVPDAAGEERSSVELWGCKIGRPFPGMQ